MFLILRPIIKFGLTVLESICKLLVSMSVPNENVVAQSLFNIMNVLFGENTENLIFVIL